MQRVAHKHHLAFARVPHTAAEQAGPQTGHGPHIGQKLFRRHGLRRHAGQTAGQPTVQAARRIFCVPERRHQRTSASPRQSARSLCPRPGRQRRTRKPSSASMRRRLTR